MTIDARLTLDLERFLLGSGYYLHTSVDIDPAKTKPTDIYDCLLVRLNTTSQDEEIARICTPPDLAAYPERSDPYTLDYVQLSSPTIKANLSEFTVGDPITIDPIPDIWERILGSPAPYTATVVAVGNPATDDWVIASIQFPCYAKELAFTIVGSTTVSGTDGVACRYNPDGETYCRARVNYTRFENLGEALNKLTAIRAEAQALVTDYETYENTFEGSSEEVFE